MSINKWALLILSSSLISCGNNFEGTSQSNLDETNLGAGLSLETGGAEDSGVSLKTMALIEEVNESEKSTEPAYNEIEKQEKKIKTINILSFLLALPFKATESDPQQKLSNPIKSVLSKLLSVVDKAYMLDDEIRNKLEKIVVELNPEIKSHAKALNKIDELHIKLDRFDAKLDKAVYRLMKSADSIILKINLKKATYLPFDPRALLLSYGKKYFTDFKADLQFYLDESDIN